MDKIKKIFSPGHSKDDEVMYGNPESQESQTARKQSAVSTSGGSEQKEHDVLRQVLNPNGANYDEEAFGPPETGANEAFVQDKKLGHLETLPEAKKKEHGILRQIFNPHGDKYDEQAFGTTAVVEDPNAAKNKDPTQLETLPEAKKNEHNVLRQILNPGGSNYDEQAYGTTAVAPGAVAGDSVVSSSATQTPGTTAAGAGSGTVNEPTTATFQPGTAQSSTKPDIDQKSAMSIKSGVEGPYARDANTQQTGPQSATLSSAVPPSDSNIPHSVSESKDPSDESATNAFGAHFGRDATLAGAGLASGGVIASELHKPQDTAGASDSTGLQGPWSKPNMKTDDPVQPGTLPSTSDAKYEDRFQPTSTSAPENPQLNTAPADVAQATFTARSYKLGDASSTAAPGAESSNVAGTSTDLGALGSTTGVENTAQTPHVPGEFPTETGEDPHGSHIGPATAAARAAAAEPGAAGFESTSSQPVTTGAQPSVASGTTTKPTDSQHDYDRDAAFAGAAGAFGIGAYGASAVHDDKAAAAPEPATNVTILGRNIESAGPVSSQTQPTSSLQTAPEPAPTTTNVTILGRNLDAPSSANSQSAPVSSTQPASTITQPQSSTASSNEHHYGRDAALAGRAGAIGAGAYGLAKHQDSQADTAPSASTTHATTSAPPTSVAPVQSPASSQTPVGSSVDSTTTPQPSQHHYARDAAVAGGAGAAGAGVYEAAKHHGDSGPAPNTTGPHQSDVANVVDPRVQPDPSPVLDKKEAKKEEKEAEKEAKAHDKEAEKEAKAQEKAHAKAVKEQEKAHEKEVKAQEKEAKKEAKAEEKAHAKEVKEQEKEAKKQEKAHEKELKAQEKEAKKEAKAEEKAKAKEEKEREKEEKEREKEESHKGRDAAIAGGAGAAAGAGAYELGKDHDSTGPASKTIGPHDSNVANVVDPRVQPDPEQMKESTTAGPHRSDLANKLDPNVESDPAQAQQQETHYGRDAAVAGGAGAAGVGAYEYGKNQEPTASGPHGSDFASNAASQVGSGATGAPQETRNEYSNDSARVGSGTESLGESGIQRRDTGPASKTIGPHKSNILNILDPRVKPDTQLMKEEEPLTTGPHRSDIANMLDPRVRSNASQSQQSSSSEQHTGRDAAVGAGAGAAVGAAAYESEQKHQAKHEDHSDEKPKHNKLQKARPDEGSEKSSEKSEKQGFLSKILHPGRKSADDRRSSEEAGRSSQSRELEQSTGAAGAAGAAGVASGASGSQGPTGTAPTTGVPGSATETEPGHDGIVIEPHTGLPMNVGKYGTYGAGGTDAAPQIGGYHETDPTVRNATIGTATGADSGHGAIPGGEGVAGPDWDAQKKQNTLY